jgi:rod shape-determining protein MreC
MLRDRQARGHIVTYVMLVAVSLLLLAFSDSRPIRDLRGGVNFALAPVQELLSGATRSVGSVFSAFAEIDQLRRENRELSRHVSQLEQANLQIPAMIIENQRLAELLKTKKSFGHDTIVAAVVYSDATSAERVITLDRGSDDGVFLNATVVSPGGALVGQVMEVGPNYSTVRLLSDTRSLVIGRDIRTRATGEVRGNLSAPLDLGNVPATDDIAKGDIVVTAGGQGRGLQSQFPKDVVIGTIIEVMRDPASIVSTALIQPAANLESLESVLVVTDFVPPRLAGATPAPGAEPTGDPDTEATPEPTRRRRTPKPTKR